VVAAESLREVEFLLGARGAEHLGTSAGGELNGRGADAARRGVDEHSLVFPQTAPLEQTAVRGEELDREAGGLLERHPVGDREQRLRVGDGVLGVRAAVGHRDDAVALVQVDALADGVYRPRGLHPGDVGRFGAALVVAAALHDVREVDARGLHLDTDLALAGFGGLSFDDLQFVARAERPYFDGLHKRWIRRTRGKKPVNRRELLWRFLRR